MRYIHANHNLWKAPWHSEYFPALVPNAEYAVVAAEDNGRVWEDSCCEFFFQLPEDQEENIYYNFECNCGGTLLIGGGRPGDRPHAPVEITRKVDRWTSLDKAPFEERMGECSWQLALCIPKEAFFRHQLKGFKGMTAHANFYKCGDLQHTPHFLSWNKIDLPKPDRKSTRLNSSHIPLSRMPSSA